MQNNKQILAVFHVLKTTYSKAKIVLNYKNNWELLVSVILSAQCTDKKVNEVTSVLFPKYRSVKFKAQSVKLQREAQNEEQQEILNFATVPLKDLERDIKSTGFYRNKAKNIQGAARKILENFGGKIPRKMEELLTIPGVARKTANIVLGNAYGIISGIAVDTHVQRVTQRLRLVDIDKVGPGKKALFFIKNRRTPAVRSPLPWSPSTRRGVTTAARLPTPERSDGGQGFGRSSDPPTGGSGSSEKNNKRIIDFYKDASPEKIEQQLMKIVPKSDWFKFTYWVIEHGRAICKAQRPNCEICPLQKYCPASRM